MVRTADNLSRKPQHKSLAALAKDHAQVKMPSCRGRFSHERAWKAGTAKQHCQTSSMRSAHNFFIACAEKLGHSIVYGSRIRSAQLVVLVCLGQQLRSHRGDRAKPYMCVGR
eukprot:686858-Amphidinium_carterae.3